MPRRVSNGITSVRRTRGMKLFRFSRVPRRGGLSSGL
nr:MAG TPA: hypothetical protein [Caudoviricetes sp.]